MSFGLVIGLLLASIAHAACPCPEPNVDYCNNTAPVNVASGYTCSSFGTGHFHTFDGSVYNFHEYGDFWLIKPLNSAQFSVQTRMLDCRTATTQAVSLDATSGIAATCNRAFAITVGANTIQLSHDLNSQNLNVYFNGGLQTAMPSYSFGVSTVVVHPVAYVDPYGETWREEQEYLPDADFYVTLDTTASGEAVRIVMIFYSTGAATIIVRLQANSNFRGNLAGLCGMFDNCAANDLYFPSSSTFNPPIGATSNAASYVITVTDNSLTEGRVLAGNLQPGDQFINDGTRPDKWAALYGSRWRVATSDSRFAADGKNYNIRHIATSYPGAGSCDANKWFPSGAPQWLLQQCGLDRAVLNDPDQIDSLGAFHVFSFYCEDFCQNSIFSFHNADIQPYQCNGICEYPQGTNEDIHGPFDGTNLPTFDNTQPNARASVLFVPTLGISGDYFFSLDAQDYCEDRTFTVRKRITCTNGFGMDKPQNRTVTRSNSYGYPLVQILAKFPGGTTRADWDIVSAPGPVSLQSALSAYPMFLPTTTGDYIFELAAYDGCQIARRSFVVTALCSSCVAPARIDLNQIKEILWGLTFNDATTGPILTNPATSAYSAKQVNSIDKAADAPLWAVVTHNWTLASVESSLSFLTLDPASTTAVKLYHVNTYADQSISDFAMMYPDGMVSDNFTVEFSINSTNTITDSPLTNPALKGPVVTQYGVMPPQREYPITRPATRVITRTTTTDTWENVTITQFANTFNPCNLLVNNANLGTATVTPTPLPTTSFNDNFLLGSLCEGEYVLELDVAEVNCNRSSDLQHVEVDCSVPPEAFVNCDASIAYNYNSQAFPPVVVDASASVDPYNRALRYFYQATSVPTGSTLTAPFCNVAIQPDGCSQNTAQFTADAPGAYDIQVSVSNKCKQSNINLGLTAYCPAPLSSLNAQVQVTPTVVQYLATPASLVASFDASSSTSSASPFLSFAWSVAAAPASPSLYVGNASIATPLLSTTNVAFTYPGNYTIRVMVNQGCNQMVPVDQAIQVVCDASITPSFTAAPNGPVVTWDDGVGFYPTLTLTDTSTFNFGTHPPAPGLRIIQWNYPFSGVPTVVGASTTFTPPNATETTYAVDMLASDGCVYALSTQQFTFRCLALVATITGVPSTATSGTTISMTANAASPRAGITIGATWSIVSAPTRNAAVITPTGANTAQTTLFVKGTYQIQVVITDGCTTANQTVSVVVSCTQNLNAVITSSSNSVPWMNNAFARVDLNGNTSDTGGRVIGDPTIQARWIISGPMYSVFYSPSGVTTVTVGNPIVVLTPNVTGNYTYITNTTTILTTTVVDDYEITIPLTTNEPLLNFPTCFYPDVEGDYDLTLELTDSCQQSTAAVTVNTACQSKPAINITARERDGWNHTALPYVKDGPGVNNQSNNYTWTVTLTRAGLRRVHFDASLTTAGASGGKLSYYWSWRYPDARYNTTEAQNGIDLPYGPQAEIVFPSVGTYYLLFTVHDGCAYDTANITVIAVCDTRSPDVDFGNGSTTARDGSTTSVIQLQNTHLSNGVDPLACTTAVWNYYNFTEFSPTGPVTGSGSRLAASLVLPFALLLSLLSLL